MRSLALQATIFYVVLAAALLSTGVRYAHAQTAAEEELRSTIQAEVTADPRAQTMSQVQISALVDSLTAQAQAQGLTASELTYRPSLPGPQTAQSNVPSECSGFTCALAHAFGLDGSIPTIPIVFFIAAALFILIFSIMREMGHPHVRV